MLRALPLALSAWLGAVTLVAAVVAPAAFRVLPTRALAGVLVGAVLPVLFWSGALLGAASTVAWWRSGRRSWGTALAVLMFAASLGAQGLVAPAIARARTALGPDLEAVPPTDPRRAAFGRLHGFSVLLLGVAALAAGGLVLFDRRRPS